LLVGFGGIVLLVWPEIHVEGGRQFLGGVVAAQLACVGWAVGSTYARRHGREENVLATAAFEMLFGGLLLLALAVVRHEWAALTFTPRTASALAYLTFVGAIAGFSAYAYALKHLPVATVSLYAYINPVIAVVLGTLVLREPFSARMALAAGVVLAGMALVRTE
jgi:drug/metabolite transporter (DMT)-like permease